MRGASDSRAITLRSESAMSCSSCHPDAASIGSTDAVTGPCVRCEKSLAADRLHVSSRSRLPALPGDDWQLEAELRSVHRLVESLRGPERFDAAANMPSPHLPRIGTSSSAVATEPIAALPVETRSRSSTAAWMSLSLGLAVFACGGVLLAWSLLADRPDLWTIGLPIALAGQAGLIVGLVLQLEGLWRSSRQTEKTLSALDNELDRVRHATTLLSSTKSPSAQSFYVHLAEGAQPQLLLADLKGQLDLLAQQMGGRR